MSSLSMTCTSGSTIGEAAECLASRGVGDIERRSSRATTPPPPPPSALIVSKFMLTRLLFGQCVSTETWQRLWAKKPQSVGGEIDRVVIWTNTNVNKQCARKIISKQTVFMRILTHTSTLVALFSQSSRKMLLTHLARCRGGHVSCHKEVFIVEMQLDALASPLWLVAFGVTYNKVPGKIKKQ